VLLRRPEVDLAVICAILDAPLPARAVERHVTTSIKLQGYVDRAGDDIARERALDDEPLPPAIFTSDMVGLSREVREKLLRVRPKTLGQASRISGVTPAAIGLLAIEARRLRVG
jgi:tRNA uridine 5-carboxymethylaminomethyl modification enzyme